MSHSRLFVLALALAVLPLAARNSPDNDIHRVLSAQVDAWNRGDIPGFMEGYAEDCTFVSTTILRGRSQLQTRYEKRYPSRDAMGKLHFAAITIRQLDERVAIVTGEWHLERTAAGGGPAGGVFSLVFEKISGTWQIVLDHTT